jgi:hypothetical protein
VTQLAVRQASSREDGARTLRISTATRARSDGRAAALLLLAALLSLALAGCETTAEESARLQRHAKHVALTERGLSIARASTEVRVTAAMLVHDSEGAAAVVSVHNLSATPLRSVPIAITVSGASGQALYRNNAPGLEAGLTSLAVLPAHATRTWVDDQVPASGDPRRVSAVVGQARPARRAEPELVVGDLRREEADGETSGLLEDRSGVAQQRLVVYVIGRRGGRIVAAGRAVIPDVQAHGSSQFHAFLVGDVAGAQLQANAPATTLG